MEPARPLVSIAIPSYNYARFIERSIRSAMSQTYENIEIIVSDNASTDDSVEIIARLAAADRRIRFTVNETNVGVFENFNLACDACTGVYIVFLSADDIMFPHHISNAVEYYRTHPECDLRHTAFAIINDQGETAVVCDHPGHRGIRSISPREELGFALTADGHYMWPSIVFPRHVMDELRPFHFNVTAFDIELLFRANRLGYRIAFDGTPSVAFRRHPGGVSSRENHIQTGKHLHDWLTLYDESVLPETLPRLAGRRRRVLEMIENRVRPLQMYAPERAAEILNREEELFNRVRAKAETIPDKLDAKATAYPRFSVILPTVSALAQLKRSIDSVLAQTESSWELIVISNDGRNIEGVVRSWVDPPHLVYVETLNTANAGVARNVGLRLARGETIAYLDEGDTWHPKYLAALGEVLDASNADVVRVGAACALYEAQEFGPGPLLSSDQSLFAPPAHPYVDALGVYTPLSAIAHRAYCLEIVGAFSEGLSLLEDWDFIARLAATPQFLKVDVGDVLVESAFYRSLAQQTLGTRLTGFPSAYQAVSATLKADPQAANARLREIVAAANAFVGEPGSIDRLRALVRSIYGNQHAAIPK
jgi:glycosyltransferase involved in cell wall biosynthesis